MPLSSSITWLNSIPAGALTSTFFVIVALLVLVLIRVAARRNWLGNIVWLVLLAVSADNASTAGEIRVASLVYALRHDGTALIIGPGGGTDVISALFYGVPKVVGVEVNPIIVNGVVMVSTSTGPRSIAGSVTIVLDNATPPLVNSGDPFQMSGWTEIQ